MAKQHEASQDVGPNNAAAEHFTATPYPSLIRESIQNSLDVVLDKSQPLRMKFEFGKLRTKTFESFYQLRSHIAGVISLYKDKAKPQYEDMLNCFDLLYNGQRVVEYIKVSDYNTKGMDYYIFRSIPVQHSGSAVSSQKCKNRLFLMSVRP